MIYSESKANNCQEKMRNDNKVNKTHYNKYKYVFLNTVMPAAHILVFQQRWFCGLGLWRSRPHLKSKLHKHGCQQSQRNEGQH